MEGTATQARTPLLHQDTGAGQSAQLAQYRPPVNGGAPSIGVAVDEMRRLNERLRNTEKTVVQIVSAFGGSWPTPEQSAAINKEVSPGHIVSMVCGEVALAHGSVTGIENAIEQLKRYIG